MLAVGAALPAAGVAAASMAGAAEAVATAADPVVLVIVNEAAAPIACEAALAHWFSMRLGIIAAGEALHVALQRDEAGALSIATATDVTAPVERIWCGRADQAWETASTVPLSRAADADADADANTVVCTAQPPIARLACRSAE